MSHEQPFFRLGFCEFYLISEKEGELLLYFGFSFIIKFILQRMLNLTNFFNYT
jgi:hypothetical protein